MAITETDISLILAPVINSHIRLDIYNLSNTKLGELTGYATAYSGNTTSDSDICRAANLTMHIVNNTYASSGSSAWLDKIIKIYVGLDDSYSTTHWYITGTFLVSDPNLTYSATARELTLPLVDLMASATEKRGSQIGGYGLKILAGTNIRTSIISTLTDFTPITNYSIPEFADTIPYDLEFSIGVYPYEVLNTILALYPTYRMYVDPDGVFTVSEIPTGIGEDIFLDETVVDKLILSDGETDTPSFATVRNTTEIIGRSLDADYTAETCTTSAQASAPTDVSYFNTGSPNLITTQGATKYGGEKYNWQDEGLSYSKSPVAFALNMDGTTYGEGKLPLTTALVPGNTYTVSFYAWWYKEGGGSQTGKLHFNLYNSDHSYDIYDDALGIDVSTFLNSLSFSTPIRYSFTFTMPTSVTGTYTGWYLRFILQDNDSASRIFYVTDAMLQAGTGTSGWKPSPYDPGNTYNLFIDDNFEVLEDGSLYGFTPKSTSVYWQTIKIQDTTEYGIYLQGATTNDDVPIPLGALTANIPYCVKYTSYRFYLQGELEIRAIVQEVRTELTSEAQAQYKTDNDCRDVQWVINPDSPFAADLIGEKRRVLSDGEYANIYTTALAFERAAYENWTTTRLQDTINLNMIYVPWLPVDVKISRTNPETNVVETFMVKSISYDLKTFKMTVSAVTYYPYMPF